MSATGPNPDITLGLGCAVGGRSAEFLTFFRRHEQRAKPSGPISTGDLDGRADAKIERRLAAPRRRETIEEEIAHHAAHRE
jgi:hypothetical protein